MEKIKYKQKLVCDPCYIKQVKCAGENRFDALKHVKTLHEGDDGCFEVRFRGEKALLGVDSGRIWVMVAEFDCEVEIDSGLSGHLVLPEDLPLKDIEGE